jgi:carboxylate-amine ligase
MIPSQSSALHLFEAVGASLEYMIVEKETLAIKPICYELIQSLNGKHESEFENDAITWSTSHALHVIKLRNSKPEPNLNSLDHAFADNVKAINNNLAQWNAMLLPTAAHPLMYADEKTGLWQHPNKEVIALYSKIFGCQGHAWNNLQGAHLNLPFQGDEEFARLHAAVRILLPLLPVLCASSPILERQPSGSLATRLSLYKRKYAKLPAMAGRIVPEPVFSERRYQEEIYQRMDEAIAPLDENKILDPAWANARGATPRFDQGLLEVSIMDIQECPTADMAIIALVTETLKALIAEKFSTFDDQKELLTEVLGGILDETTHHGRNAEIYSTEFSALFGINNFTTPQHIWQHIIQEITKAGNHLLERWEPELEVILQEGSLSERILSAVGPQPREESIKKVYHQLAECLAQNRMFIP